VKRNALGLALAAGLLATTACTLVAPVVPPPALVQNFQAPLDVDNDQTKLGSKRGTSSTHNVLGVVSWGDGSTRAAAQNGTISTIRSADYEFVSYFGVYSKYTTIVHGD
jgi:hypothetical protein